MGNIQKVLSDEPLTLNQASVARAGGYTAQSYAQEVASRPAVPIVTMKTYDPRILKRLQRQGDAARAVFQVAENEREDLHFALRTLEAEHRKNFESFNGLTSEWVPNPSAVRNFTREYEASLAALERARAALKRCTAERETARNRIQPAARAASEVHDYIKAKGLLPCLDRHLENPVNDYARPQLGAGQIGGFIDECRKAIAVMVNRRKALERAIVPAEVAIARLDQALDTNSRKGDEMAMDFLFSQKGNAESLIITKSFIPKGGDGQVVMSGQTLNPFLLTRLLRDEIRKARVADIERYASEHGPGVAPDDLPKELAAIEQAITAKAIEEEAVIRLAAELGLAIERRPDADPAVLIGPLVEEERPMERPPVTQTAMPAIIR